MRILVIRLMGLGDVACIGLPAARLLKRLHPDAEITVLTYAAGGTLLALAPDLDRVWTIPPEDWPDRFDQMIAPVLKWARQISEAQFDVIYNFDTWFMPCFLARMLKDGGLPVQGNFLRFAAREFADAALAGKVAPEVASKPGLYLDSTFPAMTDFSANWWQRFPVSGGYPEFYLQHCCGFAGAVDIQLPIVADSKWRRQFGTKRVLGLATDARRAHRSYRHGNALKQLLETRGYAVWDDVGTLPFGDALARLKASDLLVTVSSAPQWLGKIVGCKVLILPGFLPPEHLGADVHVPLFLDCQPCCTDGACPRNIDFACNAQPPEQIADAVDLYFVTVGYVG